MGKQNVLYPDSGIVFSHKKERRTGNSLAVQWLGLHTFTAEGADSVLDGGTKIPQAVRHGQKRMKY